MMTKEEKKEYHRKYNKKRYLKKRDMIKQQVKEYKKKTQMFVVNGMKRIKQNNKNI